MNIDSALSKALGRAPSAHEKQLLAGLMEAFQVRDNDGILPVLATLMRLDAAYRPVPERLGQLIHKFEKVLDQRLSASPASAGWADVDSRRKLHWVTVGGLTITAIVIFAAGGIAGAAAMAIWTSTEQAAALARVAAWLLVPVIAVYAGAWGWETAREQDSSARQRWGGWTTLLAACAGIAVWLIAMGR